VLPTSKPAAAPSNSNIDALLAAVTNEGLELFAMAQAIPGLQNLKGASFKLCLRHYLDLHYFTCCQADTVNLPSQQSAVRHRGPKLPRLLTLIYHGHRFGAPLGVFHAG
jgi:hypothetical protein